MEIALSRLEEVGLNVVVRALLQEEGAQISAEPGSLELLVLPDGRNARLLCVLAGGVDDLRKPALAWVETLDAPLYLFTNHRLRANSLARLQQELSRDERPCHVFGAVQLEARLTPSLRERLAPWLLENDYLPWLAQRLSLPPLGLSLLQRRLEQDLVAYQYPRLGSIDRDQRLPLAQVFVDLPVTPDSDLAQDFTATTVDGQFNALSLLLIRANDRSPLHGRSARTAVLPAQAGVLFMGGPGQGKSTLTQFLCQLQRASLLSSYFRQDAEVTARVIQRRAQEEGLYVSGRRVPLHVELSSLAKDLARTPTLTLLDWIRFRHSHRPKDKKELWQVFEADWMRRLLQHIPCLLVLDGLDEVPASANRALVLECIQQFFSELPDTCDLLVVCTTRPQGYTGELERLFQTPPQGEGGQDGQGARPANGVPCWTLLPLSRARALAYGRRVLETRWAQHPDRRELLLERLTDTLGEGPEGTRATDLSTSPLQVIILCTLLEEVGRPPTERWKLFRVFYETLFRREREKEIPSVAVLGTHEALVHQLHREVGFHLHRQAERGETAVARLTLEELRTLLESLLRTQGFEGQEILRLQETLMQAALQRLVLLVSLEENALGFELRSIQEFFAAAYLVEDQTDEPVLARLRALCLPQHWRNVLGMAMGYLAERRPALLQRVPALIQGLDQDPVLAEAHVSGQVAELLLAEKIYAGHPKVQLDLARLALVAALERPWYSFFRRPPLQYQYSEQRLRGLAVELLTEGLKNPSREQTSLHLLFRFPAAVQQAIPLECIYPDALERLKKLLTSANLPAKGPLHDALAQDISRHFWKLSWAEAARVRSWAIPGCKQQQAVQRMSDTRHIRWKGFYSFQIQFTPLELTEEDVSSLSSLLAPPAEAHADWYVVAEIVRFWIQPSAPLLAMTLRSLHGRTLPPNLSMPWPLQVTYHHPEGLRVANAAEQGKLGDSSDWLRAERRWQQRERTEADLYYEPTDDLPFDARIGAKGLPDLYGFPPSFGWTSETAAAPSWLTDPSTGTWLQKALLNNLYIFDGSLPGPHLWERLRFRPVSPTWLHFLHEPTAWEPLHRTLLSGPVAEVAAYRAELNRLGFHSATKPVQVFRALCLRPELEGLLLLVHHALRYGPPSKSPVSFEPEDHQHPRARLACHALQVQWGRPLEWESLEPLLKADPEHPLLLWQMLRACSTLTPTFFWRLLSWLPPDSDERKEGQEQLWQLLSAQASVFQDEAEAKRLGLPHPITSARSGPEPLAPLTGPVILDRFELQNFRGLRALSLKFSPGSAEPGTEGTRQEGQWTFLIGDNGMGKSSLLRGLAMCLFSAPVPQTMLGLMPMPTVTIGQTQASLTLAMAEGPEVGLTFRQNEQKGEQIVSSYGRLPPFFCVGYGVQRGLATDGDALKFREPPPIWPVRSLLGRGGLMDASVWLGLQELIAFQNKTGKTRERQEHVKRVLCQLLGLEHLELRDAVVWVNGPQVGEVPLGFLSDGYLTTVGWVIDLLASYEEWHERQGLGELPANFHQTMTGVVLLDELDLHLHPRWQVTLVSQLRSHFPKLSFVVTTHNPMTLLSARPGEIFCLQRDEEGHIRAEQRDLPPGASADAVLTGEWFGLVSARSPETLAVLEQYRLALRDDPEGPEAKRLAADLQQRLGSFADSSLERLAWQVAAQLIDEDLKGFTLGKREHYREAILKKLRERRASS